MLGIGNNEADAPPPDSAARRTSHQALLPLFRLSSSLGSKQPEEKGTGRSRQEGPRLGGAETSRPPSRK